MESEEAKKPMYRWSTSAQPHYITRVDIADDIVATHLSTYTGAVGFDLEWPPSFVKGSVEKPVSLVQIATADATFLFQISAMVAFPSQLKSFLENPEILKAGVGIQHDVKKLFQDRQVSVLSCVDLSLLARSVDNGRWKGRYRDPIGLARLADVYLDTSLLKGKISRSNWAGTLSEQQQLYAANDAHAGYAVYTHLRSMDSQSVDPTYYSFHAIRGRLYKIQTAQLSSSSHDHLWGLSSALQQWFPSNPNYDPGPPPDAKPFKTHRAIGSGTSSTPHLSDAPHTPPPSTRGRHRPRNQARQRAPRTADRVDQ